jgi:predicted ArsR family transcriptional regulator
MTAQELAGATGMSIQSVRADLVELEAKGKIARERGSVGKPHVWWRTEKRPLDGLDVLLIMALAAEFHASPATLREVLASAGSRAKDKGLERIVAMCAMSKDPHAIVRTAIQEYDIESLVESKRAA